MAELQQPWRKVQIQLQRGLKRTLLLFSLFWAILVDVLSCAFWGLVVDSFKQE